MGNLTRFPPHDVDVRFCSEQGWSWAHQSGVQDWCTFLQDIQYTHPLAISVVHHNTWHIAQTPSQSLSQSLHYSPLLFLSTNAKPYMLKTLCAHSCLLSTGPLLFCLQRPSYVHSTCGLFKRTISNVCLRLSEKQCPSSKPQPQWQKKKRLQFDMSYGGHFSLLATVERNF